MLALPCGVLLVLILIFIPIALLSLLFGQVAIPIFYITMFIYSLIIGGLLGIFTINIFISFAILPISHFILPKNYWVQQLGLLFTGTGAAFLIAIAAYSSTNYGLGGAMGGFITSAVYGKCVRNLRDQSNPS